MKYPQLVNTITFKKTDEGFYRATDHMYDFECTFDYEEAKFMSRLDGKTNPYDIIPEDWDNNDVEELLDFLKHIKFTQKSRVKIGGFLTLSISLFKIKATRNLRATSLILNWLLMVSFIPVFILGLYSFSQNLFLFDNNYNYSLMLVGNITGIILGTVLHEFGHAICALSYGKAKVFEAGVLVGLTPGAYVIIDHSRVTQKRRKIQIFAGGIEMNFLLSGISFLLLSVFPPASSFFYGIGGSNALIALVNLMLISGLDGCAIISELIGSDSLFVNAANLIFKRKTRRDMLSQGVNGYVKIASCAVAVLFQISYPILIAIEILSVRSLFV